MRLDVLLHELRLFKSRSQAAAAIEGGRVRVSGSVTKASRTVAAGVRITLIGPSGERTLEVVELPRRSLTKEQARQMVREVGKGESS